MTKSSSPPDNTDSDWVDVRDSWVGVPASEIHAPAPLPARVDILPPPAPPARAQGRPPPLPDGKGGDEPAPPSSRSAPFGNAIKTRAPSQPPRASDVERMLARLAASDHEGALMAAETVLRQDPRQNDALQCAQIARAELYRLYDARLGPRTSIPRLRVRLDQLGDLAIDVRAALVLALINGKSSVNAIIDVGVLTKLDTLRVLSELQLMGIIDLSAS